MDPQEYYRLYPELRRRDWYTSLSARAVMNYFIRNAWPEPFRAADTDLPAGSHVTFYSYISQATSLDFWRIKRALNQLIDEGDITLTPSGENIIVTLTHFPTQTQPQPNELPTPEVGTQFIAPAEPEQTFTTESTVPESPSTDPNKLTGTKVGAQYIAPAQAAQSNKLTSNEVGTRFIASAQPVQSKKHSFATSSSDALPPRKSNHFQTFRRKAPKKSRIRGDTIVGTGVSPCKSITNLHKPRSGDIFIRSPSY